MPTRTPSVTPVSGPPFLAQPVFYDLAALGYTNDEYFLEGTARSYAGPEPEAFFRTRAVVRRPADAGALERQRRRRVVQRLGRARRRARLELPAPPHPARGLRVRGRLGAARRRRRRRLRIDPDPAEEGEPGALRRARAPGRRLRVRHLHPGGARDRARATLLGGLVPRARPRGGRVAVGDVPRHVRELGRRRCARLRRLPDPRPRRDGRAARRLEHHPPAALRARGGGEQRARSAPSSAAPTASATTSACPSSRCSRRPTCSGSAARARARTTRRASASGRSPAPRTPTPTCSSRAATTTDSARRPSSRSCSRPPTTLFGMKMDSPMNSGPQQHYVLQAALDHLDRWAAGGAPPPSAPRLEITDEVDGVSAFALDDQGNVRGGVRTPWVDAPSAVLSGLRPERRRVRVPVRHDAAARRGRTRAALSRRARRLPGALREGDGRGGRRGASCSRRIARRSSGSRPMRCGPIAELRCPHANRRAECEDSPSRILPARRRRPARGRRFTPSRGSAPGRSCGTTGSVRG